VLFSDMNIVVLDLNAIFLFISCPKSEKDLVALVYYIFGWF